MGLNPRILSKQSRFLAREENSPHNKVIRSTFCILICQLSTITIRRCIGIIAILIRAFFPSCIGPSWFSFALFCCQFPARDLERVRELRPGLGEFQLEILV